MSHGVNNIQDVFKIYTYILYTRLFFSLKEVKKNFKLNFFQIQI